MRHHNLADKLEAKAHLLLSAAAKLTEDGITVKTYKGIWSRGNYPHDLQKLTQGQHKKLIAWLAKLDLPEIRRRQTLVEKQLKLASSRDRDSYTERGMRNLQIMQQHLDAAVQLKEFGSIR